MLLLHSHITSKTAPFFDSAIRPFLHNFKYQISHSQANTAIGTNFLPAASLFPPQVLQKLPTYSIQERSLQNPVPSTSTPQMQVSEVVAQIMQEVGQISGIRLHLATITFSIMRKHRVSEFVEQY